jgi:precorrin-6A synthase
MAPGVKIRVVGIGMGLHHVTPEASEALRSSDYAVAVRKCDGDPLLDVRRQICAAHGLELLVVNDPERDRDDPADYDAAVRDWHEARVEAFEEVLRTHDGTAAFLVWGDPSLYDSTIRIVEALAGRLQREYDVVAGVSAPQLLAARHRIVLHPVGQPVHMTTARRLREALASGQTNVVVMLGSEPDLTVVDDAAAWTVWWGANLGTPSEELVAGRVAAVAGEITAARRRARQAAGWVMDVYLLRRHA